MKLLTPWVCFVVAAGSAVAESNHQGIDAYREGQYFQANDLLNSAVNHDPVVDYY